MSLINVGLIGCGGFARGMHIPNLMKNPKYKIYAAMDINPKAAEEVAEETGASYWTDSVDKILSDPQVDVVFITTRHDSHAPLTIKAAQAKKHILCEKPMALNLEDCKKITKAVQENNVKYTVGYNRGIAPVVTKARELLSDLPQKRLIYHRIQAPFPADSWTHDPKVGGGRFIGEGCHIFDLLCLLVAAPPVSVYATGGIFLDPDKVKIPDSGIITITFADGSVGTTLIASDGCPDFPKEATEIYCGGKAIYIDNFKDMEYCGFEGQKRIRLIQEEVDKGQAVEIESLAEAILEDKESPNGLVQAARAAAISYKVVESITTDQPVAISEADYLF